MAFTARKMAMPLRHFSHTLLQGLTFDLIAQKRKEHNLRLAVAGIHEKTKVHLINVRRFGSM